MELLQWAFDIFFHMDAHLNAWSGLLGPWLYLPLFLIVFCETGLVITPFLPGDSPLFAVGALASIDGSPLSLPLLIAVLFVAAVGGDAVNYAIGYRVGPRVFSQEDSSLFTREHLIRTRRFHEKYGGRTIVLARFMPIIQTFAPFVAGIGTMAYPPFAHFNVTGGAAWVPSFVLGGYFFGNFPVVQRNFHYVIVAIIVISVMPAVVEYIRAGREGEAAASGPAIGP